ncbi:leucine-rich_repeat domain-containing protein [Hexamita inflata]|uniref:Leucine-rich repeat domain-containing protein n=1 Tax=Hexamita inflata TaxID=28002 RepID=A0AA86NAU2_9EUKA|nr:leucine-rich repeat domain-containing protein [Hexamita inflata]
MKPTHNIMQQSCTISGETKFTDNEVGEPTRFEAEHSTQEQVDKIPMHATSLVIVCSRLCSTQGINLHVNITHLDLRGNFLQTVDLKDLVNLEYADLSTNFLKEIDSISGNRKVKTLKLASNEVKNINFIATLPQLKEFTIDDNIVQDLEHLYKHHNFSPQWASIQKIADAQIDNENTRIAFWRNVNIMVVRYRDRVEFKQGQYVLSIANDQELTETVFLDYLKVTQVFVSHCHNISFTEAPKLLKQLWICSSEIKSLSGLENMATLERLTLRQCSLSRIQDQLKATKNLQNLRFLDVAQNDISNSESICNEKLSSLNASQNKLKLLNGFGNLANLTSLDVSGNQLESVEELTYLTNLKELNISFNAIKSIQTLYQLVKLAYFNLVCNKVLDIETCLRMKGLLDLRTKNNFILNGYVLVEHTNFREAWLSEQLKPDANDKEAQKLKDQGKNCNMMEKYKNQVKNNSLEVRNDQYVRSLKFSDLIGVTKELSISKCKNVLFEVVPVLVQGLKVNSSGLQNILGLEQITQITSLELSDNLLEDVIEIQELTKLTRLVLSNNRISRLHWIKALKQLKYLDLQNNRFVSVECLKDVQSLTVLLIQGNMVQDSNYLRLLKNFSKKWISPQKEFSAKDVEYYLGPNNSPQMVQQCTARLNGAKKHLLIAMKYKSNVTGSKLVIQNDASTIDLAFICFVSDFANQQIDSVSVNNCPSVICNIDHPVQFLAITNSQLKRIKNITTTILVHLDLGFNSLEEVSKISMLTNLQKLVLRDNLLSKLDCLKPLSKLVHLDIRNNKLLYINFIKYIVSLEELLIDGNCVCNLNCVVEHPKCSNCLSVQRDPILDDVQKYLGQYTKQQVDTEMQAVQEQVKQRDAMPQYQYVVKISKYEKEVKNRTWITVFNVSLTELPLIWSFDKNYEEELFGRNMRIECDPENRETVQNRIKKINPKLRVEVEVEEFRYLKIKSDDEPANLSFVNAFNLHKLCLESCQNVKFQGVANVKVLQLSSCELQNFNGILKWNQLQELNLNNNKLENVTELENFVQLKRLSLFSNNIENVDPLKGLINLTSIDLATNKIQTVDSLKRLVNLTSIDLSHNRIEIVDSLKTLVNLTHINLAQNKIKNVDSLNVLINLTSIDLSENEIIFVNFLRGLVKLTNIGLSSNQIEDVDSLKGLVNLTSINLSRNQIENVDSLNGLVNLTSIDLFKNKIKNVEFLRGLVNLTNINLSYNNIQNVDPLKWLTNIKELFLNCNNIKDFTPIRNHPNFQNYKTWGQE